MNKITKIIVIISVGLFCSVGQITESMAQRGPSNPEIAKWKFEQDEKSRWEFKNDGKLYASYLGDDDIDVYSYSITTNPPHCQEGVSLAIEKNVKFLQLIDLEHGNIKCFYVYALNSERMTVMDALTGHIFPMIKAED